MALTPTSTSAFFTSTAAAAAAASLSFTMRAPPAIKAELEREQVERLAMETLAAEPPAPPRFRDVISVLRSALRPAALSLMLNDLWDLAVVAWLFHFPFFASIFVLGPLVLAYYYGVFNYLFLGIVLLQACYYASYAGSAHQDGAHASEYMRGPNWLWRSMRRYFSGRVIGKGKYDPASTYQFCFHPHGIYPMTCFWSTRCDEFRALYPDLKVSARLPQCDAI